ncbi:MAG: helix-turn-helix domain-containing protein [Eubacteriales bacterium]|nr:helix-turn-helix domain-containing protein [Eubacteriales bacterium]
MRIRKEKEITSDIEGVDYELIARVSDALAHPVRLMLFRYIMQKNRKMQNVCTKDLSEQFDYAQATISQHMKRLVKSGLVETKKVDKFTYFFANLGVLTRYLNAAKKFAVVK